MQKLWWRNPGQSHFTREGEIRDSHSRGIRIAARYIGSVVLFCFHSRLLLMLFLVVLSFTPTFIFPISWLLLRLLDVYLLVVFFFFSSICYLFYSSFLFFCFCRCWCSFSFFFCFCYSFFLPSFVVVYYVVVGVFFLFVFLLLFSFI